MKIKMTMYILVTLCLVWGSLLHALRPPAGTEIPQSTFGIMANMSDVIGLGVVTNSTATNYNLRIEQALYGCTNGQTITVLQEDPNILTNTARIAFAVVSNIYGGTGVNIFKFDSGISQATPKFVLPEYVTQYRGRYWFYPDDADGRTYAYFTNVVRTMKSQKNWTNYYEVCRSAATIPSARVKEDGFYDLWSLIQFATDEQLNMMMNDPLLPQNFKDYIPKWQEYEEEFVRYNVNGGERPVPPVPDDSE